MITETIKIRVLGSDIKAAVESVAQNFIEVKEYVNGKSFCLIGQISKYPYEHLLVTAEGEKTIDPKKVYHQIEVSEYDWGGVVYDIGYEEKVVPKTVKNFAQSLKGSLASRALPDLPDGAAGFLFEGGRYELPAGFEVEVGSVIVLPDGRVIVVESINETYPPSPRSCRVLQKSFIIAKASE